MVNYKVGRKPGVRSEKYELAIKDYIMGRGGVTELAKLYNIDRSGLHKAINSIKNSTDEFLGNENLKDYVSQTKSSIMGGVMNLEKLKTSTNKLHNEIAEELMEELRMSNLKTAKFIHALGQRLLKDLLETTNELRENKKMNLKNLNHSFKTLETANNILGIPRNPLIALQNNIINKDLDNTQNEKPPLEIKVNVIE